MTAVAIEVKGLGKRYRIGSGQLEAKTKTAAVLNKFKAPFAYLRKALSKARPEDILWALKDVSFKVEPGGVLGIVGRNGAGKSTLLKLLARITDPTEGEALINGRIGALLEVGTGFHPEFTGRENMFLNGAILGMSRSEILAKFDQIVEFAEVQKFIDTPVKYYSSGMRVRLAFSVAAHLEPEIVIVDEVLAVGDVGFQRKCLGKMGDVASQGRTVLLVSHNMEAILGLCQRAIWLEGGRMMGDGHPREIVTSYTDHCMDCAGSWERFGGDVLGNGLITFTKISLRDAQGKDTAYAECGQPVEVILDYQCSIPNPANVTAWFWVRDHMGRQIACFWSSLTGQDFKTLPQQGRLVCRIPKVSIAPGRYLIDLSVQVGGEKTDKIIGATTLNVEPGDFFGTGRPVSRVGQLLCEHSWSLEE